MRLTLDVLRQFTDLPADVREARILLDEVGLEVKRIDPSGPGVPVTLELLANRGDHHCLTGLAREVTGRTGGAVKFPEFTPLVVGDAPHPIRVQTPLCAVYSLTLLELPRPARQVVPSAADLAAALDGDDDLSLEDDVDLLEDDADADAAPAPTGSLSEADRARLEACGLRPIHPVVDATNLANLELGQPTHAFDADKIKGPITVRLSRAGERCLPLFQTERVELPEGTLVIADDEKILAVAGVIGCEDSKTDEATTRVLLEAAAFDPVAVRKASRALSIHTDSSARFERGSDFAAVLPGASRVAGLLADAGWSVKGTTGVVSSWSDPGRVVRFDAEACRRFLGIDEDDLELYTRLERYGFELVDHGVRVPTHRLWDIEYPADLYEEIAKSIGYDNTPIGLPAIDMGGLPTHAESVRDVVADVLVGQGFYEVITDGFHGRDLPEQLGFVGDHPLAAHVETANAIDRAYSLLKNEALGAAIEGVAANGRMKHDEVKAFEFTRTFHPDSAAPNGVCTERNVLWAIASGSERARTWAGTARPADASWLKGVVEEISLALKLPLTVGAADASYPIGSALHPGRQASILLSGRTVGALGEVHPGVVAAFKIKRARPVYFEIALDTLVAEPASKPFTDPPRVPPVERDLAFTLANGVEGGTVAALLRASGPTWLGRVAIVDLFAHEEDGRAVRTLTFRLFYDNEEGNRTADEMNQATEALIAVVTDKLGASGVKLRV
jgi:phenylalanyl-tRNA synthetase beta chain